MSETNTPKFNVVAPVFRVADLRRSAQFYAEKLFFRTGFEWRDAEADPIRYAIMIKDDTELHLSQSPAPMIGIAYFFVTGVDAYYEAVSAVTEVHEPLTTQPWGMREFEVLDPDQNVVLFGQNVGY